MSASTLLNILEGAKWFFVAAYVFSTIGVTIGVYWENEKFPKEKQHRGWILLICSLAADTFFTIMVFGIEGWIGHIQRNEIIALETRLAPRILNDALYSQAVEFLHEFAGTPYDFSVNPSPETMTLVDQIIRLLDAAGWKRVEYPNPGVIALDVENIPARAIPSFAGLIVEIDQSKRFEWQRAVTALVAVLHNSIPEARGNIANDGKPPPNAVHIYVGTKQ